MQTVETGYSAFIFKTNMLRIIRHIILKGVILMRKFRKHSAEVPALTWIDSANLPRATLEGRSRVLIENHTGIIEFSSEKLRLASKLGEITVAGFDLGLAQVREKCLIVQGRIDSVSMPDGGACDDC